MSGKLYRLGKWLFQHPWKVISIWLVAIAILAGLAGAYNKPYDTKISIPGTEAQNTLDTLAEEFPAASKGSGSIVFAAQEGQTIVEQQSSIEHVVADIAKIDGVSGVVSPFIGQTISPNGRIAFASLQLNTGAQDVSEKTKAAIEKAVEEAGTKNLQVELRGDFLQAAPEPGSEEVVGIAIAALVLILTFGSLVAAGMPLLIAIVSVIVGMLSVFTASGFMSISSTTPTLAIMLGLAVGIDYSLFLIIRYVKYLKEGIEPKEAAGRAVATAGNAVIFAALTVAIALSALVVVGVPFLATMGIFAAITVIFAALATITLIPALLHFAKFKVLDKKSRKAAAAHKITDMDKVSRKSIGYRWVRFITKHAAAVTVVAVLGLGALAVPTTQLYLGLPDDSTAASDTTQRKAYDLLAEGFGPGFNGPLLAVVELPAGLEQTAQQTTLGTIAGNLKKDTGVALAAPAGISPDGKTGIIQIYPTTGPSEPETRELITRIRDNAGTIAGNGASIALTGATAVAVDVDEKLAKALPVYLAVVVGLSLLILLAVFRSVLVPLKATLGFVLTILATLGLMVMFFQWGWLGFIEAGPILSFLPILVTGILFGLAMDYQFFLVSGMHEEYAHSKDKDAKKAVVHGFAHGAKVVSAAAIIMISVFAGFILTDDTTIRSIGFALAVGVFIDAFIVRMTIVPAVMTLFGRGAWWLPNWLAKILPNLSIEGDESIFESPAKKPIAARK